MDAEVIAMLANIAPLVIIILITWVGCKALNRFVRKGNYNRANALRIAKIIIIYYVALPATVINAAIGLFKLARMWL